VKEKNGKHSSFPVGDRELPLEADIESDMVRDDPFVGERIQVSPVAGGDLLPFRGSTGTISGVIRRFGDPVGYEAVVKGTARVGPCKDFYIGREVLEGVQPPTAASAALRSVLSHWNEQRTYWGPFTDGLELLCFELASATDTAYPISHPWGWQFVVPGNLGDLTVIDCSVSSHDNVWTMSTSVYPTRTNEFSADVPPIPDHWARVFIWEELVASHMVEWGFQWGDALKGIQSRSKATREVLRPLLGAQLEAVLVVRDQMFPGMHDPGPVSVGFSRVRLSPGTVGLTEMPTDRRPYSVVSVSPSATRSLDYLQQVVLHEAIHLAVGSRGGDPHSDIFNALAAKMGLKPEYRD
jgi:hypothetical protein